MSTFFEIAGEVIELELDATERAYGRPSPTGLSSLLAMDSESPKGLSKPERHHAVAAGGGDLQQFTKFQMIGRGMAGAGASILMVPDPLPYVDELVGATMVVAGTAMFYWG
jgi:hypothetical protein